MKIKDDKYQIIHVDVEKIRHRPTQFVSSLGDMGVYHLCKELIDNASDEALKKDSPCDAIIIDITDKSIRVKDNGRGIPTDIMQEVYETMQAGTNMTRDGGMTRGENGLGGSTCLLALSSFLRVISTRPSEKKRLILEYHEAKLAERTLEEYHGKEHGLEVIYKPSRKVLGVDTIPIDMVCNWLKDFDYTSKRGVSITYFVNGKENKVEHKELYEFIDNVIPSDARLCNTLVFNCSGELTEVFMDKNYDRKFNIEAAITYANPDVYKGDDVEHSWMNMIHTPQNGEHVDGVIKGFSRYLTEQICKKNKKLSSVDLRRDILSHFNIVVKGECNFAHLFSSQAKHTVMTGGKVLFKKIEQAVYEALLKSNASIISEMVDVVIGNHRARVEGEKARDISKTTKAIKSWAKPDTYIPCSSAKSEYPKELFLVEGNSAGGGLRGARDSRYQAILMSRGKPLNVCDLDIEAALKCQLWLNLVKILECGVGPAFDIRKLKFDKIIIASDADIDGYHIRVLFLTFFMKFLPGIIEAGKLYIAEPPLYTLKNGKDESYVASQTEYLHKCIDTIADDITISFPELNK